MGKMKELHQQMLDSELDQIRVTVEADFTIRIECGEHSLLMSRAEAEDLFVDLGYALQDMDVDYWSSISGDGEDQPKCER